MRRVLKQAANDVSDTYDHDTAARTDQDTRGDRQRRDPPEAPAHSPRAQDARSRERDTPDDDDHTQHHDRRKSRWPLIILCIVVVAAVIAGIIYWLETAGLETTDDAYTEGNAISIAPKISGYVTQLNVNDNTYVKAGQLLLTIDPRDYTAALDQARANLALAQYQLSSAQIDLETTRVKAPRDAAAGKGATRAGRSEPFIGRAGIPPPARRQSAGHDADQHRPGQCATAIADRRRRFQRLRRCRLRHW